MPAPDPNTRIAWLLGSGISIPLGMPGVATISARVRSGAGVERHTDSTYYIQDPPGPNAWMQAAMVERVVQLIGVLDAEYERCRRPWDPPANYEDWYYVASQVHHFLTDEYENPSLHRMVDWLRTTTSAIRQPRPGETLVGELELVDAMREVMTFIESVVRHELGDTPSDLTPLQCLADALGTHTHHDLVVLNHDLAVERLCDDLRLDVDDGFGPVASGVRYWRGHRSDGRTKLIKPHGSVNWFDFMGGQTGIPANGNPWRSTSPAGARLLPISGTPATLIGTTNKLLEYHRGLPRTVTRIGEFGDRGRRDHEHAVAFWSADRRGTDRRIQRRGRDHDRGG